MQNAENLSHEQIREFLRSSRKIEFAGCRRAEVYAWVERTLAAQGYGNLSKTERGLIRAYAEKVTGLSASQMTRLIRRYLDTGGVREQPYQRHRFATRYTEQDIALLAEVDRVHERLSGPATRCILRREYEQFGRKEYARLAHISVAHLYNLRHSARYGNQAAVYEPTRPTPITIGERRKPDPQGRPGFLRVDTVHQGDWDGAKGVYHINAVDTVTQWQVVGCASKISESYLLPVLEAMLEQFPFVVLGFHADNGSEFINHTVAKLLDKLRAEFTKSRPNRSQDNALVEGKNGSVIRKLIGYGHIPTEHAEALQKFYAQFLNPSELSSAVRLRHRDRRSAGQASAPISGRRLPDALRKTEVAAGGHAISQTRPELGEAGPHRRREERHRMGAPDAGRQSTPPPAMQVATPDTAYVLLRSPGAEGREMPGPWKAWKTKRRFPTLSTVPWKSRNSSEIPTFPPPQLAPDGKVENPNQVSHFPTRCKR